MQSFLIILDNLVSTDVEIDYQRFRSLQSHYGVEAFYPNDILHYSMRYGVYDRVSFYLITNAERLTISTTGDAMWLLILKYTRTYADFAEIIDKMDDVDVRSCDADNYSALELALTRTLSQFDTRYLKSALDRGAEVTNYVIELFLADLYASPLETKCRTRIYGPIMRMLVDQGPNLAYFRLYYNRRLSFIREYAEERQSAVKKALDAHLIYPLVGLVSEFVYFM